MVLASVVAVVAVSSEVSFLIRICVGYFVSYHYKGSIFVNLSPEDNNDFYISKTDRKKLDMK